MKIKICGLKTIEDSIVACQAGADMLGFNFFQPSPRYIDLITCREIVARIKSGFPKVIHVGVFVNHSVDEIRNICESTQIDVVQLSGDETLEMIQKIGEMAYKALRVSRLEEAKALIENLPKRSAPPAFLIDSYEKGAYGGTGKIGSWELAAQIAEEYSILLAGGLKPENIAEAVGKVRPWGVDVASGVEQENGVKTPERIIEFIQKAKAAAEQISI